MNNNNNNNKLTTFTEQFSAQFQTPRPQIPAQDKPAVIESTPTFQSDSTSITEALSDYLSAQGQAFFDYSTLTKEGQVEPEKKERDKVATDRLKMLMRHLTGFEQWLTVKEGIRGFVVKNYEKAVVRL